MCRVGHETVLYHTIHKVTTEMSSYTAFIVCQHSHSDAQYCRYIISVCLLSVTFQYWDVKLYYRYIISSIVSKQLNISCFLQHMVAQ